MQHPWENQICSHFLLDMRGTVALCPVLQPAPVSPAADNHNHMCHIMCKRIFISFFELPLSSYWQNNKFSRMSTPNFTFTKIVIGIIETFWPASSSLLWHPRGKSRRESTFTSLQFCHLRAVKPNWLILIVCRGKCVP